MKKVEEVKEVKVVEEVKEEVKEEVDVYKVYGKLIVEKEIIVNQINVCRKKIQELLNSK